MRTLRLTTRALSSKEKGKIMIKWPITYTDYNGEERTEDFYFNINKAELMEMNLNANGALEEYYKRLKDLHDGPQIAAEYKKIILMAYGEKSLDGRRFMKSQQLRDEFEQTEAFAELYMQLATEEGAAERFITGVLPKAPAGAPVPSDQKK